MSKFFLLCSRILRLTVFLCCSVCHAAQMSEGNVHVRLVNACGKPLGTGSYHKSQVNQYWKIELLLKSMIDFCKDQKELQEGLLIESGAKENEEFYNSVLSALEHNQAVLEGLQKEFLSLIEDEEHEFLEVFSLFLKRRLGYLEVRTKQIGEWGKGKEGISPIVPTSQTLFNFLEYDPIYKKHRDYNKKVCKASQQRFEFFNLMLLELIESIGEDGEKLNFAQHPEVFHLLLASKQVSVDFMLHENYAEINNPDAVGGYGFIEVDFASKRSSISAGRFIRGLINKNIVNPRALKAVERDGLDAELYMYGLTPDGKIKAGFEAVFHKLKGNFLYTLEKKKKKQLSEESKCKPKEKNKAQLSEKSKCKPKEKKKPKYRRKKKPKKTGPKKKEKKGPKGKSGSKKQPKKGPKGSQNKVVRGGSAKPEAEAEEEKEEVDEDIEDQRSVALEEGEEHSPQENQDTASNGFIEPEEEEKVEVEESLESEEEEDPEDGIEATSNQHLPGSSQLPLLPDFMRKWHPSFYSSAYKKKKLKKHQETVDRIFNSKQQCSVRYEKVRSLLEALEARIITGNRTGTHQVVKGPRGETIPGGLFKSSGTYGKHYIRHIQSLVWYLGGRPTLEEGDSRDFIEIL